MARHRETADEYYRRTGELREDDWGAGETRPGVGDALRGAAEDALADKIANDLIGDRKGRTQAERDAKDADNANTAATAIIGAIAGTLSGMGAAAVIGTGGTATAVAPYWIAIVNSAALATRVAWAKLSLQDRAKIWRGEV